MHIEWSQVTRFSRFVAVTLYVAVFVLGVYLGRSFVLIETERDAPSSYTSEHVGDTFQEEMSEESLPALGEVMPGIYSDGTSYFAHLATASGSLEEVVRPKGEYTHYDSSRYFKDAQNVFHVAGGRARHIVSANPNTFSLDIPISERPTVAGTARDGSDVLRHATNTYLYQYAHDALHVYVDGQRAFLLRGFELLFEGSQKDCGSASYVVALDVESGERAVFIEDSGGTFQKIKGADVATFEVFPTMNIARDKDRIYQGTRATEYDRATFTQEDASKLCPIG